MSTFRPLHALLGALLLSSPVLAAPPSDAERAIEYRMAVMQVTGWNFGPMKGAVTGKVPYDKDAFALHAQRVATMAPMLPEGFPTGSYIAGKTDAKPLIWEKRAEFDELLKKFATESANLAEVAKSGDLAKIKPAFAELGKVCKSCHEKFKKED